MTLKRILFCITAFVMICIMAFLNPLIVIASATTTSEILNSYDKTNVLDDLTKCTINGKSFNINDFPFDETRDIQLISFVEYCYSYKADQRENYGLYVYVYNPKGLDLSKSQDFNKIQMAVSFDSEGIPNDYEKFPLQFCSRVESGDYKNLFYKFKIVDKEVNGTHFADRVNSNERRYCISGIELATYGSDNATDYYVGGTYCFTGYAAGCGPDSSKGSTLDCKIDFIETVSLNVKHTFYRSQTSSLGEGYQNQLDTVYFSVPKKYIETYGSLQRIKAEWWEYKTNKILVTKNPELYNAVVSNLGKLTEKKYFSGQDYFCYYERLNTDYGLLLDPQSGAGQSTARWCWNTGNSYLATECCPALYYAFLVSNIEDYDPYADIVDSGGVASNALYNWIKSYKASYHNGTLPVKEGNISADLFENDIDESRKIDNESGKIQKGHSYYDFDADVDLQTLNSWSSTSPSFWDNWLNFGLGAAFKGGPEEESKTVAPIQILKASDLTGTDKEISERLLVNVADVDDIKAEYKDAITVNSSSDEEKVVVLFRFATSDYYSQKVDTFIKNGGFLWADKIIEDESYIVQESVFLDFDIIQLTFHRNGVYTVIPAVSSPIDVIDGVTPPANNTDDDWWKILLAILALMLTITFLWFVLPYVLMLLIGILKLIVKIIIFPFKAIWKIFKKARQRHKEKTDNK